MIRTGTGICRIMYIMDNMHDGYEQVDVAESSPETTL